MGTLIAPRLRIARSAIDHSGRFSDSKAMRSPGLIPSAAKPSATFFTRSTNVTADMLIHFPSALWLRASLFPCLSEAVKHNPGIEVALLAGEFSFLSVFAEAAEATG